MEEKTTQHLCKICAVAINLLHRDRIGGTLEGYATCDDCGVEGPLNEYPIKKGGLSREWLLKMAATEDAAGSVSVGGLAIDLGMCVHCGGSILPGGECDHCGIHDGREKFHGEVSYLIVKLIRSLPRGHEVAEEAIVWLTNRGLVLEDILREVQP